MRKPPLKLKLVFTDSEMAHLLYWLGYAYAKTEKPDAAKIASVITQISRKFERAVKKRERKR